MPEETRKPLDKILCGGKFYRYVVACMHNCPNHHYCKEFWSFFAAKGMTPAEYYNEGGIGEKVMRRVVFDCDRCGKKDIGEMFGLYTDGGEGPENRIGEGRRLELVQQFGYSSGDMVKLTTAVLENLETAKGWQHFCGKCFQRMVDGVGNILGESKKSPPKAKEAASGDESPDEGDGEGSESEVMGEMPKKGSPGLSPEAAERTAGEKPGGVQGDIVETPAKAVEAKPVKEAAQPPVVPEAPPPVVPEAPAPVLPEAPASAASEPSPAVTEEPLPASEAALEKEVLPKDVDAGEQKAKRAKKPKPISLL